MGLSIIVMQTGTEVSITVSQLMNLLTSTKDCAIIRLILTFDQDYVRYIVIHSV